MMLGGDLTEEPQRMRLVSLVLVLAGECKRALAVHSGVLAAPGDPDKLPPGRQPTSHLEVLPYPVLRVSSPIARRAAQEPHSRVLRLPVYNCLCM